MRLVESLVVATDPSLADLVGQSLRPWIARVVQRHDEEVLERRPGIGIVPLFAGVFQRRGYAAMIQHDLILFEVLEHLRHVFGPLRGVVAVRPERQDISRIEVVPLDVVQHIVVQPSTHLFVPQHHLNRLLPFLGQVVVIRGLRLITHLTIVPRQQHGISLYYGIQIDRNYRSGLEICQITWNPSRYQPLVPLRALVISKRDP